MLFLFKVLAVFHNSSNNFLTDEQPIFCPYFLSIFCYFENKNIFQSNLPRVHPPLP